MNPKQAHYETLANTILKNLEKRNMTGCYCPDSKAAQKEVLSFLAPGLSVSFGGSQTLEETGVLELLRKNDTIHLIDRATAASQAETIQMYHDALSCGLYLMSTNAITTDGVLVNIDGNGNRVAALIYGPDKVLVLAGMNKVAASVEEALSRVHNTATPMNCKRLGKQTPCSVTGVCADCLSPDCICNQVVLTRRSGIRGRIHVILIGEELGY